jgi:hypothetical protein
MIALIKNTAHANAEIVAILRFHQKLFRTPRCPSQLTNHDERAKPAKMPFR